MNPLVSIIVPCYNQAEYLSDCLQSVLDQIYTNWECIIVNDGSYDKTDEIAKQWLDKDARFRYHSKENQGISATRNIGISLAVGEYILPLDGDDKIAPQYIDKAIEVFNNQKDVKLVYSDVILFGEQNRECLTGAYVFEKMLTENLISCSAMFRRSDFIKTEGYNLNMVEGLEDWDFWLTFLQPSDRVIKLKGYYLYYRIKNISRSTLIDREKNERLILQIFKNHLPLYLEYFNPIRDHIETQHYKLEVQALIKSPAFRIGSFLYAPIKLAKRAIRKLFK